MVSFGAFWVVFYAILTYKRVKKRPGIDPGNPPTLSPVYITNNIEWQNLEPDKHTAVVLVNSIDTGVSWRCQICAHADVESRQHQQQAEQWDRAADTAAAEAEASVDSHPLDRCLPDHYT